MAEAGPRRPACNPGRPASPAPRTPCPTSREPWPCSDRPRSPLRTLSCRIPSSLGHHRLLEPPLLESRLRQARELAQEEEPPQSGHPESHTISFPAHHGSDLERRHGNRTDKTATNSWTLQAGPKSGYGSHRRMHPLQLPLYGTTEPLSNKSPPPRARHSSGRIGACGTSRSRCKVASPDGRPQAGSLRTSGQSKTADGRVR